MMDAIAKNMHMYLLSELPPNYEKYIEVLASYFWSHGGREIKVPPCKEFPDGLTYHHFRGPISKTVFHDVPDRIMDSVRIHLDVISSEQSQSFYPYNHKIFYDREKTMGTWAGKRFGAIYGTVNLAVHKSSNSELISAIMMVVMQAYLDYLSLTSMTGYTYINQRQGGVVLYRNTQELTKCSTDPCVNLIGDIVDRIDYIPKMEITLSPENGASPHENIDDVIKSVSENPAYMVLKKISDDIDTVEQMSKDVNERYLCDMWTRGMRLRAITRAQVISLLRSWFDNVKNPALAEIAEQMVHINTKSHDRYRFGYTI